MRRVDRENVRFSDLLLFELVNVKADSLRSRTVDRDSARVPARGGYEKEIHK